MEKLNKKGVTLLELIIVMVIIAIGATLVAPNIGRWLQHYQLRSATRDIVSTMRTAQMRAVSTNMEHQVSFTIGNPGSYILQRNSGGWVDDGARQTLPTGAELTVTTPNFEFNPNSTATGGNVTLAIRRGGQVIGQRIIRVLATTGRIRIEE
jgi:general secretion pathway protein H